MFLLHIAVLTTLLIYVFRVSNFHINTRVINAVMSLIFLGYTALFVYMLCNNLLYAIEDGQFHMHLLFSVIAGLSFLATVVFYIEVLFYKKDFSRPFFRYLIYFMPLILCVQLVQIFRYRSVYVNIVYMIPFVVFYFLFHNVPYDSKTGTQSLDSLDTKMSSYFKDKKPFDLIFVDFSINNYDEVRINGKSYFDEYWKFLRKCEYLSRSICVYQYSFKQNVILLTDPSAEKREQQKRIIENYVADGRAVSNEDVAINVYEFKEHESINSVKDGKALLEYILRKYDSKNVYAWNVISDSEYEEFDYYSMVKNALVDINEKCDLDDERVLCYVQPIYNVEGEFFENGEALMRLQLDGKLVPPNIFIPIAEDIKAIHTLTKIILNKVCKFIAENKDKYHIASISVNVAMVEMSIPSTERKFLEIIESNGIDPSYIRLELTESTEIEDMESNKIAMRNLIKLHEAGVRFYLDDFGTGYSNLVRILDYKIHTIKFDKSMLYKAIASKPMEEILDTMTRVFKDSGSHILVEGVENKEQADFAKKHGFEYIQGFYYASPVPIEDLKKFLS